MIKTATTKETKEKDQYFEAVGRRKTSTARVRITKGAKGSFVVNEKSVNEYFKTKELQETALSSLKEVGLDDKFKVSVKVVGGGVSSQAGAVRHGLARALAECDSSFRAPLKKAAYLKRDPRMKERRKFGLKKARKAPQWSKR